MLKICPRMASTLFFLMWPKSKVVQVDRERLTVAKFSRAKTTKALCKCIFMGEPVEGRVDGERQREAAVGVELGAGEAWGGGDPSR